MDAVGGFFESREGFDSAPDLAPLVFEPTCAEKKALPVGCVDSAQDMAVGQNLRYLLGDDYPPKVVYFKGFLGVHRGSGVLTHSHVLLSQHFPLMLYSRIRELLTSPATVEGCSKSRMVYRTVDDEQQWIPFRYETTIALTIQLQCTTHPQLQIFRLFFISISRTPDLNCPNGYIPILRSVILQKTTTKTTAQKLHFPMDPTTF